MAAALPAAHVAHASARGEALRAQLADPARLLPVVRVLRAALTGREAA